MKTIRWHVLFSFLVLTLASSRYAGADIVVVVNPKNPVRMISGDDIARIFSGTLRTYPSTGMAATAIDQPSSSSIYENFYRIALDVTPDKMKRRRASYLFSGQGVLPIELADDSAVKNKIASSPSAIGYINADALDKTVVVIYRLRE